MNSVAAAHVMPTRTRVFSQQLRLLWISRRPVSIAALMIGSLLMVAALLVYYNENPGELFVVMSPIVVFASAGWGVIVWREEGPARRTYHWSLPFDTSAHDIARVAAGAVWLCACVGAFVAISVTIAFAAGKAEAVAAAAPLLVPHYLLAPLIAYLLAASIATVSNKPAEWMLGGFIALQVLAVIAAFANQQLIQRAFELFVGKPWGVGWALVGGMSGAMERINVPDSVNATSYYTEWLPAALLWLVISCGILAAAARARRGRV